MPVTTATEQGVPTARPRRKAYLFLQFRILDFLLAVWAVIVLLISAHAVFGTQPAFLSAFDVSVAPF
jgi:hypothetical protein